MRDEETACCEAAENSGREGRIQRALAVEIPRRKEASERPVTMEGEDGDLEMRDAETVRETTGFEASQHATTNGFDNTLPINADTKT